MLTRRRASCALACAVLGLAGLAGSAAAGGEEAAETALPPRAITPVGCALEPMPKSESTEPALRVTLVYGKGHDLDLQVTGPRLETVYFANPRARAGGRLLRDARCDDPAPRREEVVFDAPRAGRYRISLNHAARCGEDGRPEPPPAPAATGPKPPPPGDDVPFAIEIEAGGERHRLEGSVPEGRFVPIVCEFDLRKPG